MPINQPGRFIVLEGPDGGGKTTQAARLVTWLRQSGIEVVACRDPGGTALGDRLRELLQARSSLSISMRAEMFLFMASRSQLIEEIIAPALARGAVVVSDRFLLSNVVYQGHAGGLKPDEIWRSGEVATSSVRPDLTILLDVPLEIASARTGGARDRIEDRDAEYRKRVRNGYLDELHRLSTAHALIDGSLPPDEVELLIRDEVQRALGIAPRT